MNWINFNETKNQRNKLELLDSNQFAVQSGNLYSHNVVKGVAGSGKSLLLRKRIERIANDTNFKNVLVLTYNRFMAGWTENIVKAGKYNINLTCSTFHSWASRNLGYKWQFDEYVAEINAKHSNLNYDAILVDEAQDFKRDWIKGLVHMLNKETNSLLLVFDFAQSVFGNPNRKPHTWSLESLFVNAKDNTYTLDVNYRNSPEIICSAWNYMIPYIKKSTHYAPIISATPNAVKERSSNTMPLLLSCVDENEIAAQVCEAMRVVPNSTVAVMFHPHAENKKFLQPRITEALIRRGIIPHSPEESEDRNKDVVTRPGVVVDSWKALKGVEFNAVILVGVDYIERYLGKNKEFEEMAGLYSAMTRARDHLVMLYDEKNQVVEELSQAISQADAQIKLGMSQPGPYIRCTD